MLYNWDPAARVVRFSTTVDRIKVKQLRNDPRAALHVSAADHWSFAVAEGEAEISDVTTVAGDPTGQELLGMLPAEVQSDLGQAFFDQLVAEQRVVIRLMVSRLYGTALDVTG
jgi:hypothetical protein